MAAPARSGTLSRAVSIRIIAGRARQRGLADIGIAVLVPMTAAMFGLVLEDAIPVGANPQTFSFARWAILLGLLGLLVAAVFYRRWVYHGTGTLFSLSFLEETMVDYHEQALADAARRHMAVQLLGRRVDLLGREHEGVVDVVQPRQELSRALENAMNQDREDTGYAIAPNLLWPAALTVGFSLTRTDKIRFLEYGEETTAFRLRDRAPERVAVRTEPNRVLAHPTGDRLGVLLSFTQAAVKFDIDQRFREFGVRDVAVLGPAAHVKDRRLTGPELGRLADDLAGHLAYIKRTAGDRELVVVAFLPKTVALLSGWYLSRQKVRFFAGTHLMHYLGGNPGDPDDRFVALRMHPSQPTTFPAPRPGV